MKHVHTLLLPGNSELSDIDDALVHLAFVHTLSIARCCKVKGSTFMHLRSLHTLVARNTSIVDESLAHLTSSAHIHSLDVSYTSISDAGLLHIADTVCALDVSRCGAISVN